MTIYDVNLKNRFCKELIDYIEASGFDKKEGRYIKAYLEGCVEALQSMLECHEQIISQFKSCETNELID